MTNTAEAVERLITAGFATARIDTRDIEALARVLDNSLEFFRRPATRKLRHSGPDANYGYRPMGIEYSVTPDSPDRNECFTLWSDRTDLIPEADELSALTDALLAWRTWCMDFTRKLIQECADRYRGTYVSFAAASHLQVNNCLPTGPERELLQDRHEDGHLLTILHATAPGLEIFVDGSPRPIVTAANEVLVMPGSILAAMTDGHIAPLYHQVRNLRLASRQSVMYFVNPELAEPLLPWVGAERTGDLRSAVRANPLAFGLPAVEEL